MHARSLDHLALRGSPEGMASPPLVIDADGGGGGSIPPVRIGATPAPAEARDMPAMSLTRGETAIVIVIVISRFTTHTQTVLHKNKSQHKTAHTSV